MNMIVRTTAAAAVVPALAQATPENEAKLLRLEEQIFAEKEAINGLDSEIAPLAEIFEAECRRLMGAEMAALASDWKIDGIGPSREKERQIWDLARKVPAAVEQARLEDTRDRHSKRMCELIDEMWATPANTPEGRQAKFFVLLNCVLAGKWSVEDGDWRAGDWEADWHIELARNMMIEFIGGEPATLLREQFS
jgi:hypothetical protein